MSIELHRDKATTFFYFKTSAGRLPAELQGFWTQEDIAKDALETYQLKVQGTAAKNSAQVRKAKAKEADASEHNAEATS